MKRKIDRIKEQKHSFNKQVKFNRVRSNEKQRIPASEIKHGQHTKFCPKIGRNKLLFSTIKSVEKYLEFVPINFNSDNDGYVPKRYYWCDCCRGYHTTHKDKTYPENLPIEI